MLKEPPVIGRIFRCELPARTRIGQKLARHAGDALEHLLAINRLNAYYNGVSAAAAQRPRQEFLKTALDRLNIKVRVSADDLARIPKTGPAIIVSNHPFGAIEGVMLAYVIGQVREDYRLMANFLLEPVPELRETFFFVDPFGGDEAMGRNLASVRQAIRWVRGGQLLGVFPAGEVSHLRLRDGEISDPPWTTATARIARITGAPVVPVYFAGANSALFQLAGLVHPRLRTAMLIREFLSRRNERIEMRIGTPISPRTIESFDDDEQVTAYLRERTYVLRHRARSLPQGDANRGDLQPIVAEIDANVLAAEFATIPREQILVQSGEYIVAFARAPQIPNLLAEIGRLREIAYRSTGEGTGKPADIDSFDYDYLQLFIWSKRANHIIGGYRLGLTDELLAAKGRAGLYTSTLFEYSDEALRRIDPALELGRSFVVPAHQKAYAPLLLLWKGIGQFIFRHPRYKRLYGPVSISNTYSLISKQLMVRFLRVHHGVGTAQGLVTPKNPFRESRVRGFDDEAIRLLLRDGDEVSTFVSEIEADHKGIPVLLRQYLKFGAHLLALNVDPDFSDVLDGLLMADLTKTDRKVLERYMGAEGVGQFLRFHGV